MNDFEKQKREILQPIYFEAGAGLFDCQSFEYTIAYLIYLLSRLATEGLSIRIGVAILENEEKKTAGQLVNLLKKHVKVSEGLEETLTDSLRARNELIHRYLIENIERLVEPNEHKKLVQEIRSLRTRIQNTQKQLDPFVKGLAEIVDGMKLDDLSNEVKARFMSSSK